MCESNGHAESDRKKFFTNISHEILDAGYYEYIRINVKIIQKGESKGQGVGYLDDGTMAVVDNAFREKNKTITATVDRMIQTKAGKMVFATYKKSS